MNGAQPMIAWLQLRRCRRCCRRVLCGCSFNCCLFGPSPLPAAGVLSFPFAFRQLGWAAGLAAVAAIASIEGFSLYALCRYAEHTKTTTYSSMVRFF